LSPPCSYGLPHRLPAPVSLGPGARRSLERTRWTRGCFPPRSACSAVLSALGSLLSQVIERSRRKPGTSKSVDLSGPLRFAIYGFLFTGPLSHYFYLYLEQLIPPDAAFAVIKRLLVDRLLVAPPFLVLFFFVMNLLEGKDLSAFTEKMRSSYWAALKMNWKVWTPVQFVNVNYVPLQFRVLFGNLVALFWFAYLASIKK
uniref:Peroxisomal membrane protein 2 n=1 Tax=Pelodiscus sinensis TaxID=13735 RepID=K7GB37_PELSI